MSDRTNFTEATRETTGWTALGVFITVVFVLVLFALGLFYTNVIRPSQLAGERNADVQSVQNLAGQRAEIARDMQDYSANEQIVARLNQQPQNAARDQQITATRGAMQSAVLDAHSAADNLPDINLLPTDQQQFLKDHPR